MIILRTSIIRFLLIVTAFYSATLLAQAEANNFSLGESEYEEGNYKKALSYFDNALKQKPHDATTLYYRANTLIKLGLRTQALLDYQHAYKLAISETMRAYCQEAISSLASNTGVSAMNNPSEIISANSEAELKQSMGAIQLQSAMNKVRIIDTSEMFAQNQTMKQRIKLAEMQKETQKNLQQMKNSSYYDQYGNKQSRYSSSDVQSYEQERQQQEQAITQSIDKASQGETESAELRAQLSDESAANLQSQFIGDGMPGGVKLDPLGTNLYVRNYDTTPAIKPLPKLPDELVAKEQKL